MFLFCLSFLFLLHLIILCFSSCKCLLPVVSIVFVFASLLLLRLALRCTWTHHHEAISSLCFSVCLLTCCHLHLLQDVDTIYLTQDTRELNLQDFIHLENRYVHYSAPWVKLTWILPSGLLNMCDLVLPKHLTVQYILVLCFIIFILFICFGHRLVTVSEKIKINEVCPYYQSIEYKGWQLCL